MQAITRSAWGALSSAFASWPYHSLLNGWAIDVLQLGVVAWLLSFVTASVGGVTLYMLLFNRSARPGLHDLICRTYVVDVRSDKLTALPTTERIHWIISSAIVIVAVIYATVLSSLSTSDFTVNPAFAQVLKLPQLLQDNSRFFSVNVTDSTSSVNGKATTRALQVQIWYKGVPAADERNRTANDIAKTVLTNIENPEQYDELSVSIVSAFDLGIAQGSNAYRFSSPISEWRQKIGLASSP